MLNVPTPSCDPVNNIEPGESVCEYYEDRGFTRIHPRGYVADGIPSMQIPCRTSDSGPSGDHTSQATQFSSVPEEPESGADVWEESFGRNQSGGQ
jgi:hypothetical protein